MAPAFAKLLLAIASVSSLTICTSAQANNHYNAELDNQIQANQNQYSSRYHGSSSGAAVQQTLQRAGVNSGITESNIPSWAADDDVCKVVQQCEDCNVGEAAYCKWTTTGQSQCCTTKSLKPFVPGSSTVHIELPARASVNSAIDTAEYPAWANLGSDKCVTKRSCDLCLGDSQYCRYTDKGRSKCCSSRNADASVEQRIHIELEGQRMSAGVTSAIDMDLPSWARPELDICLELPTCDKCHVGDSSYCHYTQDAKAHCCVKSPVL